MELRDVMRTTFSCREWTDEPVDDGMLHDIFDVARFAPTGGNRQGVRVIVVRDSTVRQRLGDLIVPAMNLYAAQVTAGEAPRNTIHPSSVDEVEARAMTDDRLGVRRLFEAPVVLVFTLDLSVTASTDSQLDRVGVISGASVYPFVWNVLLAARDLGLGGVLTTAVADAEPQVQDVLAIPSHHAVAALVPIGHPTRQLTKLTRSGVEELVTIDRFDGLPFTRG